jgi:hypothetical protein
MSGLARLFGMSQSGDIQIENQDMLTVRAILESGEWVSTQNRTVHVRRLWSDADLATLARILEDVEKMAVSGEHGALGLQSSRQRKREEALEALSQAVLTPCFLASIDEEYGVTVTVALDQPTIDEAWMARFEIKVGNETIVNICLDSFSGRWGQVKYGAWVWSNEIYTSPRQLQEAIETAIEAYLAT